MSFQMPTTIAKVLGHIQSQDYVLPAIQREFVWNQDQIARLFDSLLRDYPIGSFLFWKVDGVLADQFKFYGFIRGYHQLNASHCPVLDLPHGKSVTAILDGQQRLTALNIGLRGSLATRMPGRSWKNPAAYPVKRLFLNLCSEAPENELGMDYDFRFFEKAPIPDLAQGIFWFPVHRILEEDLASAPDQFHYILEHGLNTAKRPFDVLSHLYKAIHEAPIINYYEETAPDLDKVLDIFIRVNSGGTVLSYSDLLLSIATAQWSTRDARDEIQQLVDELNDIGQGFAFTKDIVLKAGLVLTEVSDVGFKVTNFNRTNMSTLEQSWDSVAQALRLAVGLLADFGFSGATLTANSVVIPLAYYAYRHTLGESYRTSTHYAEDRARVSQWIIRTLVKPGIWGSGLDTLLRELRRVLSVNVESAFPVVALEAAMAQRGKALSFSPEEIDDLAETSYGHRRAFPLLALLFSHVDTRNLFHVDHVFPRALFKRAHFERAGLNARWIEEYEAMANRLPNLQLLEGTQNTEKQAALPLAWAERVYPDPAARTNYLTLHALDGLPATLTDFPEFYEARKRRLVSRLAALLGVNMIRPVTADPGSDLGDLIRLVLTRRDLSHGQRALLGALYQTNDGLFSDQLHRSIGCTPEQFSGVLGALGRRVGATPGASAATRSGIEVFMYVRQIGGVWHYRLHPDARPICEELGLTGVPPAPVGASLDSDDERDDGQGDPFTAPHHSDTA
jgi:hypothetical protein